jgi:hypothetical protein
MELVRVGALDYEDIAKQRALYSQRQSKLGVQLSESTTQRVIVMILILLIIIPVLIYSPSNNGPDFAAHMVRVFNRDTDISQESKWAMINSTVASLTDNYNDRFVNYLSASPSFGTTPLYDYPANRATLRNSATIDYTFEDNAGAADVHIIYSFNYLLRLQAQNSITLTLFVAIMLVGGAVIFTNDAQRMVIDPIERMINMVEQVAANPLQEFHFKHNTKGDEEAGDYETRLLESTIEKITGEFVIQSILQHII